MITLSITKKEKFQIQYLLPIQGNLKTLELVQQILNKLSITENDQLSDEIVTIEFEEEELNFIKFSIEVLNQNQKLYLAGLSLVKKILQKE